MPWPVCLLAPPPSLKLFIKWLTLFINHLTLFEAIFRRIVIIYYRWCFFWQQYRCQLLGLRSHPVISPLRNSSVLGSHSINSEVHIETCENRKTKQSYTHIYHKWLYRPWVKLIVTFDFWQAWYDLMHALFDRIRYGMYKSKIHIIRIILAINCYYWSFSSMISHHGLAISHMV